MKTLIISFLFFLGTIIPVSVGASTYQASFYTGGTCCWNEYQLYSPSAPNDPAMAIGEIYSRGLFAGYDTSLGPLNAVQVDYDFLLTQSGLNDQVNAGMRVEFWGALRGAAIGPKHFLGLGLGETSARASGSFTVNDPGALAGFLKSSNGFLPELSVTGDYFMSRFGANTSKTVDLRTTITVTYNPTVPAPPPIPIPATMILLGSGMGLFAAFGVARRRRRTA